MWRGKMYFQTIYNQFHFQLGYTKNVEIEVAKWLYDKNIRNPKSRPPWKSSTALFSLGRNEKDATLSLYYEPLIDELFNKCQKKDTIYYFRRSFFREDAAAAPN